VHEAVQDREGLVVGENAERDRRGLRDLLHAVVEMLGDGGLELRDAGLVRLVAYFGSPARLVEAA
jgi:hypothetical protein